VALCGEPDICLLGMEDEFVFNRCPRTSSHLAGVPQNSPSILRKKVVKVCKLFPKYGVYCIRHLKAFYAHSVTYVVRYRTC
jgi:hypothetical protein